MIVPGITIGDNSVIGAGIDEHDREYYFKNRRIDWQSIRSDRKEEYGENENQGN